jgi:uncharacterized protein (TIGR02646 family)
VRPILRSAEPASFVAWKALASADWQPDWDNFSKPQKPEVWQALLRDQGFVCCYCEQAVKKMDPLTSHMEHLQPRHSAPHLALEFTNLLVSCQGELPKAPAHCGHLKADATLDVHPLMPDCREFFVFDSAGGIRPSDDPVRTGTAQRTIKTLGLDIPKLVAGRRAAINGAVEFLSEGPSAEEIQQFIQRFDARDGEGRNAPFASAVVQFLKAYLPPLQSP